MMPEPMAGVTSEYQEDPVKPAGCLDSAANPYIDSGSKTTSGLQVLELHLTNAQQQLSEKNNEVENLKKMNIQLIENAGRVALLESAFREANSRSLSTDRLLSEKEKEIQKLKQEIVVLKSEYPAIEFNADKHSIVPELEVQRTAPPKLGHAVTGSTDEDGTGTPRSPPEISAPKLDPSLLAEVVDHVQQSFRPRDDLSLRKTFDKCKDTNKGKLTREGLKIAMTDLDHFLDDDAVNEIFDIVDADGDNSLDFDEFKAAVKRPSKLEQWTMGIPMFRIVASGLVPLVARSQVRDDPLRALAICSEEHIATVVEGMKEGLHKVILKHLERLKAGYDAINSLKDSAKLAKQMSKFSFGDVVTMNCGRIEAFFDGLGGRVGSPNINFFEGMKKEHNEMADSYVKFKTTNYEIETCPSEEWRIVEQHDKRIQSQDRINRVVPNYNDLLKDKVSRRADLGKDEIIAVILYTGPMFQIYNLVLRQGPADLFQALKGNLYSTTIHCLVSGVTKISRVTEIPDNLILYRGLGNLKLPDHFYKRTEKAEYKGFVEWGFMSTTSDKKVAIEYTGIAKGKKMPTLLKIHPAAVDHGADISMFSQFPSEREYLWNPCSLVEPAGEKYFEATPEGVVSIIPVRMNMNVKTFTIQEIVGQKRKMHLDAFAFVLGEIKQKLSIMSSGSSVQDRLKQDITNGDVSISDFIASINGECKQVYELHKSHDNEYYVEDQKFRGLVVEMLEVKMMAISKLQYYLEDKSQWLAALSRMPLRSAHRAYIDYFETLITNTQGSMRQTKALQLCKLKGLVIDSVEEKNNLGETRIEEAAADGADMKSLKLLVYAGADVKSNAGSAAVVKAASAGHTATVRALVSLGANVDGTMQQNDRDISAAQAAAASGHSATIQELYELRADFSSEEIAIGAARGGHTDTLQLLENIGVQMNARHCLLHAAVNGHTSTVMTIYFMHRDQLRPESNEISDDIQNALNVSAAGGHLDTVRVLHALGASVNFYTRGLEDAFVGLPLTLAAAKGHSEMVKLLIELKANVDGIDVKRPEEQSMTSSFPEEDSDGSEVLGQLKIQTPTGQSVQRPLHVAVEKGNLEIAQILLNFKADPHAFNPEGNTVLKVAQQDETIRRNLYEMMGYGSVLICVAESRFEDMSKFDVHELRCHSKLGWTPLHEAVLNDQHEFVEFLIHKKADLNHLDFKGRSALDVARHERCLFLLMDSGVDDFTPLMAACGRGSLDVVQSLVQGRCDLSAKNRNQQCALHIAASFGASLQIVRTLVGEKADLNARDSFGHSAFDLAASPEIKEELMLLGSNGWTPLMVAALKNNCEMTKKLINQSVDVNARNDSHDTALHVAARLGHIEVLKSLLAAKANPDIKGYKQKSSLDVASNDACKRELRRMGAGGWTYLMIAAADEDLKRVNDLITEGVNLAALNSNLETALHVAARGKSLEIFNLLVHAKADISTSDVNGLDPLSIVLSRSIWQDLNLDPRHCIHLYGAQPRLLETYRGSPDAMICNISKLRVKFSQFSTVRALLKCCRGQRGYYEMEILSLGDTFQAGFCSEDFLPHFGRTNQGTGDDAFSWGADGVR